MSLSKKTVTVLSFLALIPIIALVLMFKSRTPQPPTQLVSISPTITQSVFNLKIDYDNGQTASVYTYNSTQETAFSLLRKVASQNNLTMEIKQYDFGTMVTAINDLKNSPAKAWIFTVNGQSPQVAADKFMLTNNDTVEWKYTVPE